jgi:Holliday junction resolvase
MLIFTYCSCRSLHYGYQYCRFSSEDTEKKLSFLSSELSELPERERIPKEFIKWCENFNGWQLALRKSPNKEQYLLMVGQLEKSRELEKKIKKWTGDRNFDENSLDSDYYMTLGFLGSLKEIKRLAVYMLKQYKLDGFSSLFDNLENTIRKTDDATRYEINTHSFNSIFDALPEVSSAISNNSKTNNLFDKIVQKVVTSTDTYLSVSNAKRQNTPLYMKRKNIDKCIETISGLEKLTGITPLLIAYDYFKVDTRINIRIDYEYLWNY